MGLLRSVREIGVEPFWHGRDLEKRKPGLKVNPGYWIAKIERNMERDHRVNGELAALGWEVIRFWDVDIKSDLRGCVATVQQSVEARKRGSD